MQTNSAQQQFSLIYRTMKLCALLMKLNGKWLQWWWLRDLYNAQQQQQQQHNNAAAIQLDAKPVNVALCQQCLRRLAKCVDLQRFILH